MLAPGLVLTVLLSGSASPGAAPARLADRIVATVNLHAITYVALTARLKPLSKLSPPLDPAKRAEAEKQTLDEMIDELLISDDATRLHLESTDADIDRAVDDVAAQNKFTLDELWKAVKDQGMERDEYREMLRQKLTELRWLQYKVSSLPRPDGGSGPEWMEQQRGALVVKLRADAVVEVRR
jgi:peptidyl-prolyl cis-trans isomerase SurA